MASAGPDFHRDSSPLPLQLLTGFKLKHGRLFGPIRQKPSMLEINIAFMIYCIYGICGRGFR
jgi:hypothetical protein